MVSFRRVSSLLCVCAILCCFIGMAMPVSAADTDMDLFTDLLFDFSHTEETDDLGFLYFYTLRSSFSLSVEDLANFLTINDSNSLFFYIGSSYVECSQFNVDEAYVNFMGGNVDSGLYFLQLNHNTSGDPYDQFSFASTVDLGQSFSLSLTNYVINSDPAVSGFLGDLGEVASSGLGLVGSVVNTIVNNPFLLLTVGFFFAGAAVAILGRILGRS